MGTLLKFRSINALVAEIRKRSRIVLKTSSWKGGEERGPGCVAGHGSSCTGRGEAMILEESCI
jgi:hypothetical protein